MKKIYFNLLVLVTLLCTMSACSSTEIVGAEFDEPSGEVTVSANASVMDTRAPSGMKLRYKAFLFTLAADKSLGDLIQAQEFLADNAGASKFIFSNVAKGDYVMLFVGDYVASNPVKDAGKVIWNKARKQIEVGGDPINDSKSAYYTTGFNAYAEPFSLNMQIDGSGNVLYNNEGYEVFAGKKTFTKGNSKVDLETVTLTRPVCRISFQEKESSISNLKTTINKFAIGVSYDLFNQTVIALDTDEQEEGDGLLRSDIAVSETNSKELFFYYAFASAVGGTPIAQDAMEFTITGGIVEFNHRIEASTLQMMPNYKYVIKGNFVKPGEGDVDVSVTTNSDWNIGTDVDF